MCSHKHTLLWFSLLVFQSSSFPHQFSSPSHFAFVFSLLSFYSSGKISAAAILVLSAGKDSVFSLTLYVLFLSIFISVFLLSQHSAPQLYLLLFLRLHVHSNGLLTAGFLIYLSFQWRFQISHARIHSFSNYHTCNIIACSLLNQSQSFQTCQVSVGCLA